VDPRQQQKVQVDLLHHQEALLLHHQLQKFLKMKNLVIMIWQMLKQWKMLMHKLQQPQDNYGTDQAVNPVKVHPYL
jgi:hypothetical protein